MDKDVVFHHEWLMISEDCLCMFKTVVNKVEPNLIFIPRAPYVYPSIVNRRRKIVVVLCYFNCSVICLHSHHYL